MRTGLIAFGGILMVIGVIVMISTTGIIPPSLSFVKVETPAGSATIGDISEEKAVGIGVGAIISVLGLSLLIAGAVKR